MFADDVLEALARLPQTQRQVLELRFIEGLSDEQVAEQLATSSWTVRRQMQLAVASLRLGALLGNGPD